MNTKFLTDLDACDDAIKWAAQQRNRQQAWQDCERGDWMLWYAGRVAGGKVGSKQRKRLVLCACECARLALPYAGENKDVATKAIETAEAYCRGETTEQEVRVTADAAFAAADAAYYAYYTAVRAAANAAYAAYAVYSARAARAAIDAPYTQTLAKCADIVRKHYLIPPEPIQEGGGE